MLTPHFPELTAKGCSLACRWKVADEPRARACVCVIYKLCKRAHLNRALVSPRKVIYMSSFICFLQRHEDTTLTLPAARLKAGVDPLRLEQESRAEQAGTRKRRTVKILSCFHAIFFRKQIFARWFKAESNASMISHHVCHPLNEGGTAVINHLRVNQWKLLLNVELLTGLEQS